MNSTVRLLLFGLIACLLLSVLILWRNPSRISKPAAPSHPDQQPVMVSVTETTARDDPGSRGEPLLGERILQGYAAPTGSAERDLTLVSQLMENFLLLVKTAADQPLSANEDWAAELCGRNPAHERFIPEHHAILDAQGRLVDRWGTPLFFHALGDRRFEIRSAGPDRAMWTADDIQRNADGSFSEGAAREQ